MDDDILILTPDHRHPEYSWTAWRQPSAILQADSIVDVQPLLKQAENASRHCHVLGFISYDAAPAFDPALEADRDPDVPLAWFAVFDAAGDIFQSAEIPESSELPAQPALDATQHARALSSIKNYIARGDTYQVNFTFPMLAGPGDIDPLAWFLDRYRRQPSPQAFFIRTPAFSVACLSPELFFKKTGRTLVCKPMKGTRRRGRWPDEDAALRDELQNASKDRAENLMIVDMVRNDLARIPGCSEITTESLFDLLPLPTVWQMTSTVTTETDAGLIDILYAMFPSASITGAPKVRTSAIIRELESAPRGLYTGSMMHLKPGGDIQANVAIRTAWFDHATKSMNYGVGSGIVWDSDPAAEYRECLQKALVLRPSPPPFRLLETILWNYPGTLFLLEEHLHRLSSAASYFGYKCPFPDLLRRLQKESAQAPGASCRIRILLDRHGAFETTWSEAPPIVMDREGAPSIRVSIAQSPVDADDPFLYHKTTHRDIKGDAADVILYNANDHVTECTYGNVVAAFGNRHVTPPVSDGLLAGTFRTRLLHEGVIEEASIPLLELHRADALYFINSVQGWRRIIVPDQATSR